MRLRYLWSVGNEKGQAGIDGVSAVVPVYNSETTLGQLVERIAAVLGPRGPFEIILVDDGSRDGSWKQVEALATAVPGVRGLALMRNFGQHNAVLAGIRAARFATVVTLDDDLQHPPEEIPKLLDQLDKGYMVVYGAPIGGHHGLWRDVASIVTKVALQGPMGADTARIVSAFRAFRAEVCDAFANYNGPFVSVDVLLTWGTTKFGSVSVEHHPRREGSSNYTFRSLISHAVNMATGFSTLPLQLASIIGFAFSLLGLAVLAWVLGRYIVVGHSVSGFPFLASAIAIFSGAQLFALGIIGEYLARMHFRTMQKPSYVIETEV